MSEGKVVKSEIRSRKLKQEKVSFFSILLVILSVLFIVQLNMQGQIPKEVALFLFPTFLKFLLSIIGGLALFILYFVFFFKYKAYLNRENSFKLFIILLVYIIFGLFLYQTSMINVVELRWNFLLIFNSIFSPSFIKLFLIMLASTIIFFLFSLLIGKRNSEKLAEKLPSLKINQTKFHIILISVLLYLNSFTGRFIWNNGFGFRNSRRVYMIKFNNPPRLGAFDYSRLLFDNLLLLIIISLVSISIYRAFNQFAKNQVAFSMAFISSLILAFVLNYGIQAGISEHRWLSTQGGFVAGATFLQVVIFASIFLLIYMIINRYIISTGIIVIITALAIVGNYLKFASRLEPVFISDLSWLQNPTTLLSFVSPLILIIAVLAILAIIVLLVILSRRFYKGKISGWKGRLSASLIAIVAFALISQNFLNFTADLQTKQIRIPLLTNYIDTTANGDVLWQGNTFTAQTKSLSFVWMRQAYGTIMQEPAQYSKSEVEAVVKKYTKAADEINKSRTNQISDQTVIYILSESLANPNRVSGVSMSENPLPNIDNIIKTNTGGLMFSNGYGGGTANMENQSLLGLPMTEFDSNVSILNSDVVPRMNFMPAISNYFDSANRIALHPENAANYNRNIVYKELGFKSFYALTNAYPGDTLKNQKELDGKVTDEQTYQDILDHIKTNKNQFFSVMTMQNHMPYNAYTGTSQITASGQGYSAAANQLLQNYARKINTTDDSTQKFLDQLKTINKKITVVFYGDHLPGLYPNPAQNFKDDPNKQYETDYFIWSNQDGNVVNKQVNVNSSEFTPLLLETQNAKLTPYYALLTKVMNELPADYDSVNGSSVKLNATQEKLLQDLRIVQYDLTAGKHYLTKNSPFFKMPK